MKYIPKNRPDGKWSLYNTDKKQYSKIIFKTKASAISQAENWCRVKIKKPIISLELSEEESSEEEEPIYYGYHQFTQNQIECIIKTLLMD